ncbi:hypothetical protein GCM10009786_17130 [Leucobacter alluvii]|uniref:Uncharacterized protein n=1 Tax=Leucobacter alluvii TaxID=340321 RepID=A0ABP5MXA4_9MICO
MLAERDRVDAEAVGENGLLDDVSEHLRVRLPPARVVECHVTERIEAEDELIGGGAGDGAKRGHAGENTDGSPAIPSAVRRDAVRRDAVRLRAAA